jgi:two-component system, NtrC family, sensor kinase
MDQISYTELLERAKAESDRRVKAIFEGVHTFVILALADGTVVEINRSALAFRNLQREEVTGAPLWDGPWPAGDETTRLQIMQAMEDAAMGDISVIQTELIDSSGQKRRFSVTCQPVFGARGVVLYVLVEAHDMTDFLNMQDCNRQLELEMMQNQKMESLGTLAGGVAHEINTPMQYIRDNLDFLGGNFDGMLALLREAEAMLAQVRRGDGVCADLQRRAADWSAQAQALDLNFLADETPQAIRQSCDGVERVCEIVRAIKLFSRADHPETAPESLEKLVANTLMVSRNQWKYVAEVITDVQPDMPQVHCHAGEISQVVLNLVINAVHAIEDKMGPAGAGGRIVVTLRAVGDKATVTVADNGAGIEPRHQGKIFDLFYTTKEPGRGSGHGLSICRTIVTRKHNGSLTFQTEVGVGTAFTVTLPIHGETAENRASAKQGEPDDC